MAVECSKCLHSLIRTYSDFNMNDQTETKCGIDNQVVRRGLKECNRFEEKMWLPENASSTVVDLGYGAIKEDVEQKHRGWPKGKPRKEEI